MSMTSRSWTFVDTTLSEYWWPSGTMPRPTSSLLSVNLLCRIATFRPSNNTMWTLLPFCQLPDNNSMQKSTYKTLATKDRFKLIETTVETYDKKSYDKKSRLSIFDLWMPESSNLDLKIGFLIQNCVYSQLEVRKIQTLAPRNAISYRKSPP